MKYAITALSTDDYCTLAMAKKQLRIEQDFTDEDDLIQEAIEAAISQVENYCNVIFGERDFTLELSTISAKVNMGIYPVNSITSLAYKDLEGDDQTIQSSNFSLFTLDQDRSSTLRILGDIPEVEKDNAAAVTITGKVGLKKVPPAVKKAVRLLVGDADTYREDKPLPGTDRAWKALCRPYKY